MPRSSIAKILSIVATAALIAAACSGVADVSAGDAAATGDRDASSDSVPEARATPTAPPSPRPTPTPEPDPAGRAELPDDLVLETGPRLAIQTSEGQIFTVLGDGSNVVALTEVTEGRVNTLPTWSQDANRLAWLAIDEAAGDTSLRSARFDGSAWRDIALRDTPTYLAWGPSGRQVATLGPGPFGILELGVADIDQTAEWRAVDEGTPFWFSWSPDGDAFLVHASGLRLDFVPLEGPSQVLEQEPGLFQAPRWLDGAVQLIYADEVAGEQFLVVAGPEGAGRRALVSYDGYLQFSIAPESGLIALHVIDPSLAPIPDVITASFQDDFTDIVDAIPRGELTLMAEFGGDPFVLYPDPGNFQPRPVVGFFWSPDGGSLAWLVELDPGDGDCASETAQYEWQFWTSNTFLPGPRFTPTPTFACDYIPRFDQFEQSVSFWSPDSTVLTYAGTDLFTGERGIWNLRPGVGPQLMAAGEIAVWSPDAAGSAAASSL
jgi:TolB protein